MKDKGPVNKPDFSHEAMETSIRREMESRLSNPPKSLVDLIEGEVQKRIKRQEWFYGILFAGFVTSVLVIGVVWWHSQVNDIPQAIQKELAEQGVTETKRQIAAILEFSIAASNELSNAKTTANLRAQDMASELNRDVKMSHDLAGVFTNRLNEIRKQDNVILDSDFEKYFITENITNFNGTNLSLQYEPVEASIQISIFASPDHKNFQVGLNKTMEDFEAHGKMVVLNGRWGPGLTAYVIYARKSLAK